jgi:hypothetical protein
MAKHRRGSVNPVMSKVALVGGAAVICGGVALTGAGAANAQPNVELGHPGTFINHQIGHLGTFLNHQAGDAGNFFSVQGGRAGAFALDQTGHTVSGLLNSLAGK